MPVVKGKKYPYTPAGEAAANRARANAGAGAVERKKKAATPKSYGHGGSVMCRGNGLAKSKPTQLT